MKLYFFKYKESKYLIRAYKYRAILRFYRFGIVLDYNSLTNFIESKF